MGQSFYSHDAWSATRSARATQSTEQIFHRAKARAIHPDYDPKKITFREARDSNDHPESTPIILGLDETGSMHRIPDYMAREGLGNMVSDILAQQPVTDPQIAFIAIGDAQATDEAPLQVSQFESDNRIDQTISDIWLEGRGGNNESESYDLPWFFADKFVRTDAWEKRQKKGYLFTIGDEPAPDWTYSRARLVKLFGDRIQSDVSSKEMLAGALKKWKVFHVIIEEGSRGSDTSTKISWKNLLGPNALFLDNYKALPALIVATISVAEGKELDKVLSAIQDTDFRESVARTFRLSQAYIAQEGNQR